MIAAAGDIACSSTTPTGSGSTARCHQRATSDLLVGGGISAVLTLGDLQYQNGTLSSFNKSYDPTWGRVKPITFPSAGNHEYKTAGAQGYFDYFNGAAYSTGRAGDRDKGYYSFDVGTWHLIALELRHRMRTRGVRQGLAAGAVAAGGPGGEPRRVHARVLARPALQLRSLGQRHVHAGRSSRTSMTPTPTSCSAATHTTTSGSLRRTRRASSTTPAASANSWSGTGGAFFTALSTTKPNSQVRNASTYGVLLLTLHPNSYDWRFVPEPGKSFTDSGSENCHGVAGPRPPVPRPSPQRPRPIRRRLSSQRGSRR